MTARTAAIALRLQGRSHSDIAQELGISRQRAYQLTSRLTELLVVVPDDLAEALAQLWTEQGEGMTQCEWHSAILAEYLRERRAEG